MNREELKNILPHREPMLLLDSCELQGENLSIAKYLVKGDEFFLQGHFPDCPIVPGVILCEIMAQGSCMLFIKDLVGSQPLFTAIKDAKFKKQVKIGDLLVIESSCDKVKKPFYFVQSVVKVNGEIVACGNLSFALIKKDKTN